MFKYIIAVISCLVIIQACKQEEKPLTKEEVKAFGKKLELSIDRREGQFFDEAIDERALIKKMKLPRGASSDIRAGLRKGMQIGTKLVTSLSSKGFYTQVKQYEKQNIHHLLFRLYDNGMLNYHDMELKRTNGQPKIADIYIYMTGEDLSATLRDLFNEFANDKVNDKWIKKMPEMRDLIIANKHQEALDIYNEIPEKLRKNRTLMILYVQICSGLPDEKYSGSIAEYELLYPNEPNMQLLLADGYIMRQQYEKALKAINELDKMIDKDPLLDLHRGNCYGLMGQNQEKRECFERLVKNLPDFEDGLVAMINDYLETKEYEKAKPLIDYFRNISSFDQSTLTNLLYMYPGYNEKYNSR